MRIDSFKTYLEDYKKSLSPSNCSTVLHSETGLITIEPVEKLFEVIKEQGCHIQELEQRLNALETVGQFVNAGVRIEDE